MASTTAGKPRSCRRKTEAVPFCHVRFREPLLSRNLANAEELPPIGRAHGRSAGEVAIAWTLRLSAVTGAIVGARSARQVQGVMGGGDFRLSGEEVARIEALRGRAGNRE